MARTCDERQALDAVKVGVLDGHDARIRKELLGVVVHQLPVDEAVDAVPDYRLHLVLHLVLLRLLDVRDLRAARMSFPPRCAIHMICLHFPAHHVISPDCHSLLTDAYMSDTSSTMFFSMSLSVLRVIDSTS